MSGDQAAAEPGGSAGADGSLSSIIRESEPAASRTLAISSAEGEAGNDEGGTAGEGDGAPTENPNGRKAPPEKEEEYAAQWPAPKPPPEGAAPPRQGGAHHLN